MNRAYSLLTIRSVDEDQRVIRGVATTPSVDRMGDIVEPLGIKFKNPLPLLLHHRSDSPVGTVRFDKATKDGLTFEAKIPHIDEPGNLKDRVDEAWQSVKAGLIRGVSIGFRAIERAMMEGGGIRFLKSELLELSLVSVPANQDATIQTIKSFDTEALALSGRKNASPVVRLTPPAAGKSKPILLAAKEATTMKTTTEQIREWEAKRAADTARMEAIMSKASESGSTLDDAEDEEYETLKASVKGTDKHLVRLNDMANLMATKAKPVIGQSDQDAGNSRQPRIQVLEPKLDKGIGFAKLIKAKSVAMLDQRPVDDVLKAYWPEFENFAQKNVAAGTTTATNWAKPLYDAATQYLASEFAEYLRPQTIIGKFGVGNVPSLRRVPFNIKFSRQTSRGSASWVGEGVAKPVTEWLLETVTLTEDKVAGIAVITEELARSSAPSAEQHVRDELARAVAERIDIDFIDPTNSGTANVKPAAITYQASTSASGGDALANIIADVIAVSAPMTQANMPSSSLVWIMGEGVARALSLMFTTNGIQQFPGVTTNGGTFVGYPVIVSQYVPTELVILVATDEILLADDGNVSLSVSREASIGMVASGSSQTSVTGTGASLVSMFQTNSIAVRAERYITWARRRTGAVAYLTSVNWGGTQASGDI